eukprot:3803538-Pleurochrysis_carterae.AAC.1
MEYSPVKPNLGTCQGKKVVKMISSYMTSHVVIDRRVSSVDVFPYSASLKRQAPRIFWLPHSRRTITKKHTLASSAVTLRLTFSMSTHMIHATTEAYAGVNADTTTFPLRPSQLFRNARSSHALPGRCVQSNVFRPSAVVSTPITTIAALVPTHPNGNGQRL